jgi:putative peptide zinc metalloprotease protein
MLPTLRSGLKILPAAPNLDGSPTWVVFDPIRDRYHLINWTMHEIISRWHLGTTDDIVKYINSDTPLHIDEEDIEYILTFLSDNELIAPNSRQSELLLGRSVQRSIATNAKRIFMSIFYFRLPLLKIDKFIGNTVRFVSVFFSYPFFIITAVVAAIVALLLNREWDKFLSSIPDPQSFSSIGAFAIALAISQLVHELSHAYVAKSYGCRVRSFGIVFIILFPLPYTDISDAWRLPSRLKRSLIAAAGLTAEFILAIWCAAIWFVINDGLLKDVIFMLATATWIMSLLINSAPWLKFDGYFIVSDILNMPNLHSRSFNLGRWHLRNTFLGANQAVPEQLLPEQRGAAILFAYFTWIYRFFIFLSISVIVYNMTFKVFGIALFVTAIFMFILRPILHEMAVWWGMRMILIRSRRFWVTLFVFVTSTALLLWPMRWNVEANAALESDVSRGVYLAESAKLVEVAVKEGDRVASGDILARLVSHEIDHKILTISQKISRLQFEYAMAEVSSERRARLPFLVDSLEALRLELEGAQSQKQKLTILSPAAGIISSLRLDLTVGQTVASNTELMRVRSDANRLVIGYAKEDGIAMIRSGAACWFHTDSAMLPPMRCTVTNVETLPRTNIESKFLLRKFGGPVESKTNVEGNEEAVRPMFKLTATLADVAPTNFVMPGTLKIQGTRQSLLGYWGKGVAALIMREGSF